MSGFGWCPHAEDHTPCPDGYIQWHAWAEDMSKTHRQIKCGECGRYSIWIPKASPRDSDASLAEDAERLSPEGVAARARSASPKTSPESLPNPLDLETRG